MIAYWRCLRRVCACTYMCVCMCVRTLMSERKMSISTFRCFFVCSVLSVRARTCVCVCKDICSHAPALARVFVCVCVCVAIILGVDDLWSVLWLPQGTYKTTEWPFIAFLLCLALRLIHHSVFPFCRCLALSPSLYLVLARPSWSQFLLLDLSLGPSVPVSNLLGLFSLIKAAIDHLSPVHQWNHHYCVLLFVTAV